MRPRRCDRAPALCRPPYAPIVPGAVAACALAAFAVRPGGATFAAVPPAATVTIEHGADWRDDSGKPVSIRVAEGPWRRVPAGGTAGPFAIPATPTGRAVAFDVRLPVLKAFRRWAVLVPNVRYRVVGNACGTWGLDIDPRDLPAAGDDPAVETIVVDATALPAALFPLAVSTLGDEDDPSDFEAPASDFTRRLDAPGKAAPLEAEASAMCPRSGVSVSIRSAAKGVLFRETLILHPRHAHTLRLAGAPPKMKWTIEIVR